MQKHILITQPLIKTKVLVTWTFDLVVIPLLKESHPSMRAWIRSLGSQKIYVCVSLD